jgi:hypothetical protein
VANPAGLFGDGESLSDEWLDALTPRGADLTQPDAEIIVLFHSAAPSKLSDPHCFQRLAARSKVMGTCAPWIHRLLSLAFLPIR